MVMVITGNSRGKKGRILEILRRQNKALVEGINMVTKHLKPSANHPNGGIEKRESPVHISNLKITPFDSQLGDYGTKRTVEAIEKMDITAEERKKIFEDNARKLLRLAV